MKGNLVGRGGESGEDTLRKPFGGVGVGGARSFACTSWFSLRSPLSLPFLVGHLLRSLTRSGVQNFRRKQAEARRHYS